MKVAIGTFGSLEVATESFVPRVNDYVFAYGLKQILNDAHASITKKSDPDISNEDRNAKKMALAEKKLASLLEGNVAQARQSRGDAIARMAWQLAEAFILSKLPQIGKKRSQFKTPVWNALVEKQLEAKRADYMERARAAIGDESEEEFDLGDLEMDDEEESSTDESDETDGETDESTE